MNKGGQIQISFGMIFSIIIIIVTIAIAGYVISQFIIQKDNISCKLFQRDLQNAIDKAWAEDLTSRDFKADGLPEDLEKICFGNSSLQISSKEDKEAFDEFKLYSGPKSNMLFYPADGGCKDSASANTLEHVETDSFFCVESKGGEAKIKLTKGRFDKFVKLSEN